MEFLLIYVREAHPTDGRQAPANVKEGILLESAKTLGQKEEHATACTRKLNFKFPALIDGMDNTVATEYSGWPTRVYIIGKDGRVRYKSRPLLMGMQMEELDRILAKEINSR
ncbi:MAG: deiodinase [Acidobacteria bacterium]|nr:deiodinase [Acidobacteriota bacterium]